VAAVGPKVAETLGAGVQAGALEAEAVEGGAAIGQRGRAAAVGARGMGQERWWACVAQVGI
jgi:hypothetical protein